MKGGKEGKIATSAFTHQKWVKAEARSILYVSFYNNDYVKSKLLLEWFIIIVLPTRFPNNWITALGGLSTWVISHGH